MKFSDFSLFIQKNNICSWEIFDDKVKNTNNKLSQKMPFVYEILNLVIDKTHSKGPLVRPLI